MRGGQRRDGPAITTYDVDFRHNQWIMANRVGSWNNRLDTFSSLLHPHPRSASGVKSGRIRARR